MKKIKNLLLTLLATVFSQGVFAQSNGVEMADVLRSNGKIYAVVAVCLTILIGLFLYLVSIDRKIKKIEKGEL